MNSSHINNNNNTLDQNDPAEAGAQLEEVRAAVPYINLDEITHKTLCVSAPVGAQLKQGDTAANAAAVYTALDKNSPRSPLRGVNPHGTAASGVHQLVIATSITWETDGEVVDLPTSVVIPKDLEREEIADYLSDRFGFLVLSFDTAAAAATAAATIKIEGHPENQPSGDEDDEIITYENLYFEACDCIRDYASLVEANNRDEWTEKITATIGDVMRERHHALWDEFVSEADGFMRRLNDEVDALNPHQAMPSGDEDDEEEVDDDEEEEDDEAEVDFLCVFCGEDVSDFGHTVLRGHYNSEVYCDRCSHICYMCSEHYKPVTCDPITGRNLCGECEKKR